jgi:hypothetical protein
LTHYENKSIFKKLFPNPDKPESKCFTKNLSGDMKGRNGNERII